MIGNITTGESFGGLLSYLFHKEAGYKLDSNMVSSTPTDLATEFEIATDLRPEIKKPVYHVSLSLEPGEHLNDERWREAVKTYLERMGFDDNQYVAVRHDDRAHDHCHIVINRVNLNGYRVNTYLDYYRSQEIIRDLEQQYELTQLQSSWESSRTQQPRHEIKLLEKTRQPSVRRNLQENLRDLAFPNLTMLEFLKKLKDKGIKTQIHFFNDGKIKGISYQLNGINYPGYKLGSAYSFNGLQKYFDIIYSPEMNPQLQLGNDLSDTKIQSIVPNLDELETLTDKDLKSLYLATKEFEELFGQKPSSRRIDGLDDTSQQITDPQIISGAIDAARIMYDFIEKYGERLDNGELCLSGDNWICKLSEDRLTVSRKLDNKIWLDISSDKIYVFDPTTLELSKLEAIQQYLENEASDELGLENDLEHEL